VFATRHFIASDFLLKYRGNLVSGEEAEKWYDEGNSGLFLYLVEQLV